MLHVVNIANCDQTTPLWTSELVRWLTDAVNGMGLAEDGSQAEVADLDLTLVAVHEDVVTLEVPVDDGRIVAVQVQQAAEDLPAPVLHRPYVHPPVPLPVPNHHQSKTTIKFCPRRQEPIEHTEKRRNFCD